SRSSVETCAASGDAHGSSPVWRSGSDAVAIRESKLLRSKDAGETFEVSPPPLTPSAFVVGSQQDIYLAGGRSLAHSGAAAARWTFQEPFADDAVVEGLAADDADLYAVGGHVGGGPLLAHSNDRGRSWTEEPSIFERGWLRAVAVRSSR